MGCAWNGPAMSKLVPCRECYNGIIVSPVAFKLPGDPDTTVAAALYAPEGDRNARCAVRVRARRRRRSFSSVHDQLRRRALAARGVTVVTFNFPYMEKRRKTPDRAPVLEDAFRRAVVGAVAHRHVQRRRSSSSAASRWAAASRRTSAPALDTVAAMRRQPSGVDRVRLSAGAAARQAHRRSRGAPARR